MIKIASSLIALSLAVDYWDYLGWKDTLADPRHAAPAALRVDRRHADGTSSECELLVGAASVLNAPAWPDEGASIADWVNTLETVANDLDRDLRLAHERQKQGDGPAQPDRDAAVVARRNHGGESTQAMPRPGGSV